ncbi:PsiF family protein [Thiobacillus sp.]|uniref:PsiF family protein n=1 Tax=Thiobacillus sp. TaxID=924 RepID=UPI0025D6D589|nr:PsiF family protein [Thiobacillus sp.]
MKPNFWLFTTAHEFLQVESEKKQGAGLDCGFHSTKERVAMKRMLLIGLVAGALLATGAWAETAQQERMKSCNADAGKQQLSGDARKAFMKSCLSGGATPGSKATAQQQRMKDCNAEASGKQMKGDARKAFMKSCLSGKSN